MPRSACSGKAFGHSVDADHHLDPAVAGDPAGHVADRAETEDDEAATTGHLGPLDCLPGCRQHIGEVHEAVVGRAVWHLDRPVVGVRHS